MSDRIDDLLHLALVTGEIPAEATPEEHEELEGLLAAMRGVKATGFAIQQEARATMPTARARFERFTAAQQQAAHKPLPAAGERRSFLSRVLGGRGLSFAGVAAAMALLVAGAFVLPGSFGGVESASAQVLTEGSYVQVEGVVETRTDGDGQVSYVVQSDLGEIPVDLGDETSVLDGEGNAVTGGVPPGRMVVVSGVVGEGHRVKAQTVAVGQLDGKPPRPPKVEQVKDLPGRLEGEIRTISLSPDGQHARVHIVTVSGGHFWAEVEAPGLKALLERSANVLGTNVRLIHPPGAPRGVFVVEPVEAEDTTPPPPQPTQAPAATPGPRDTPASDRPVPSPTPSTEPPPPAGRPGLVTIRGVVIARDGALVTVETETRDVTVRLTARTVILIGPNGVTLDAASGERAVGHQVSVTGVINEDAQQLIADLVVLGPKPPQGDQQPAR